MKYSIRILLLLLAVTSPCRAHYVWIEPDDVHAARVYFGEYQEGLREKAGGRLDERTGLEGWAKTTAQETRTLRLEKASDHFSAALDQEAEWVLVQDLANPVKDWREHDIGIVKPMFYARVHVQDRLLPAKPVLTLDIVPVVGNADELQVLFKQAPLAKAKVLVYAPNQWLQEFRTDADGKVKISTPWPGRYVIDVAHKEPTSGEFGGTPYDAVRHRATLAFTRP